MNFQNCNKPLGMTTMNISSLSGISSFFTNGNPSKPAIVTRGTRTENTGAIKSALPTASNNGTHRVYCAVFESKEMSPVVGLCFVDPFTSELKVTEIMDSQTYVRTIHKLNVLGHSSMTILIPDNYRKPRRTNFLKVLESNLPQNSDLCFISPNSFRCSDSSLDMICNHFLNGSQEALRVQLSKGKYALASTVAILSYLNASPDHHFIHQSFNIKYESPESHMFISTSTIENLELVENKFNEPILGNTSLFSFLDSTVTQMGKRLLKLNILQPLTDVKSILMRHKAVDELLRNEEKMENIRSLMQSVTDMNKLVSCLCKKPKCDARVFNDQRINLVLLLKQCLTIGLEISSHLEDLQSDYIISIHGTLQGLEIRKSLEIIDATINADAVWASKPTEVRNNKCYAIKSGHNGLLDTQRQVYKAKVDEALDLIAELSDNFSMIMTSKYEANRGFFIVIHDQSIKDIQLIENSPFINAIQRRRHVECTTMKLVKLNNRIDCALKEVFILTENTIEDVIKKLRAYISDFFMVTEAFALLDLLCSFAVCSNKPNLGNYICPEINETSVEIKESKHPILQQTIQNKRLNKEIIANDYICDATSKFNIITGSNMSGKSCYVKQIALITILVQIGMLIPADYVSTRIFHSLFARIGNDVSEPNMSTFSTEMVEMAFILQYSDKDTLCIIDELGRGTSYTDGISISLAMIETMIGSGATCFFVTHFNDIPKFLNETPGVSQLYMDVAQTNDNTLKFKYKAEKGYNKVKGYGISMAEKFRLFPKAFLEEAKAIASQLKILENDKDHRPVSLNAEYTEKEKLMIKFIEGVKFAVNNADDNNMISALLQLERDFVNNYAEINESIEGGDSTESEYEEERTESTSFVPLKGLFEDSLVDFGG